MPMLCRAGQLTKRDIGAIRVQPTETHVELAPDCVDRFLEAVGPDGVVEKTIPVSRMETPPPRQDRPRDRKPPRRPQRDRKAVRDEPVKPDRTRACKPEPPAAKPSAPLKPPEPASPSPPA